MNVNLEDFPNHYLLVLKGKFNEGIQHLFHQFRQKLSQVVKPTYIDLSEVLLLKDRAAEDLFRLMRELERQGVLLRIVKTSIEIIPQLQKDEWENLLMSPEELKTTGFPQYLDANGNLPYTLPLPPLQKIAPPSRPKVTHLTPEPSEEKSVKKRTVVKSSPAPFSKPNNSSQLVMKLFDKNAIPSDPVKSPGEKKKFVFKPISDQNQIDPPPKN